MSTVSFAHFVFVDFENVPSVDLGLIAGMPAHVTLLIGKNQKSLSLALVQQLRRQPAQVDLVETGVTGRNALDMILTFHLGQAVLRTPGARFYIVSKDKDYDPLISHLHARDIKVSRAASFDALPFLPRARKPAPGAAKSAPAVVKPVIDRRVKVVARLLNPTNPARPSSRTALLAHLKTALGKAATDAEGEDILRDLIEGKKLTIDPKGKVGYSPDAVRAATLRTS